MFIQTQWLIIEIIFYPQIAKELIEAGGEGGGKKEIVTLHDPIRLV